MQQTGQPASQPVKQCPPISNNIMNNYIAEQALSKSSVYVTINVHSVRIIPLDNVQFSAVHVLQTLVRDAQQLITILLLHHYLPYRAS